MAARTPSGQQPGQQPAQQPPPWQQPPPPQGQPWQQQPQQPPSWQQQYPSGSGWQPGGPPSAPTGYPAASGSDGFAKAGLILGILPFCGGVLGVVFGIIALGRIRRTGAGGRGMAITGIVVGTLWFLVSIGLVALAIANPSRDNAGHVTSAQTVDLKDLKIGDCVAQEPVSPVKNVKLEPCSSGHVGEIYDVTKMPGSSYPGNAAVNSYTTERCRRLLPLYVNTAPGQSGYSIYYVAPSKDSWRIGRRFVVCMLITKSGELTGSAKGAGHAPN